MASAWDDCCSDGDYRNCGAGAFFEAQLSNCTKKMTNFSPFTISSSVLRLRKILMGLGGSIG